jgi:hypothetical protein
LQQEITHIKVKIDTAEKAHRAAQKSAEEHGKNVEQAEHQIA